MDLVTGVVLVGSTIVASWAWQRYRRRLLTVGHRSARSRRTPRVRVERRSTAWARADQAGRSSVQLGVQREATETSEAAALFRAGGTVGTRETAYAASLAGADRDWKEGEVQGSRTKSILMENGKSDSVTTLEGEVDLKQEAIRTLEAMVTESHRALARERERVTVLEKKGRERAREAQLLRDEVRSLDSAIGHLNERLIDAQRRVKARAAAEQPGAEEARRRGPQAEADQPELDAATAAELERRANRIVALEQRVRRLTDDVEETHTRYRQREQHIDRLEKNIAEFAKQVQQRDQRVSELVHAVRTAERVADTETSRACDLQRRIDDTPDRVAASARTDELEARLAAREHRIDRLSRVYRAVRRQHRSAGDDLKRIRGVGPAIERKLRAAGIARFAQLARMTPEQIAARSEELAGHAARIERDDWIGQAAALMRDPR